MNPNRSKQTRNVSVDPLWSFDTGNSGGKMKEISNLPFFFRVSSFFLNSSLVVLVSGDTPRGRRLQHLLLLLTLVKMKEVLVIVDGMSEKARSTFLKEVDQLRGRTLQDLATERGSSIDLFEDFNVEEKDRKDADGYFQQRWRNDQNHDAGQDKHIIRQFLLESLPTIVKSCCSTSTDQSLYLFNESYIIKEPHSNVAFRWHTDANEQLCSQTTPEYYSCCVALDDANEANGTLFFPESTAISEWQAMHSSELRRSNVTNHGAVSSSSAAAALSTETETYDTNTDTGTIPGDDDIGVPLNVPAGTIIIFSSSQWHRSSINTTDHPRRVLYVQYSFDIISSTSDGEPLCFAVLCSPIITNPNTDPNSTTHSSPMIDNIGSESTIEPPFVSSKRHKQC